MAIEIPEPADIEGPPCGDCIHQVVCGLRSAYQTFIRARFPIAGDLPIGLSWRIAVDCEHFISMSVVPPFGRPGARALEDEGSGDWLADAVRDRERSQTEDDVDSGPDDAPAFNDPDPGLNNTSATDQAVALQEATPDVTPVVAKARRPMGEAVVTCEPGCGKTMPQAVIGAHRRTCEAVAAIRSERGVTVVPDLLGSAAPLPEAAASDFDAKRQANAKEAADRTWRQNHVADEVIGRTAEARQAVEKAGRTPTTPIEPAVPPSKPAKVPSDSPLTLHQRRVLAAVLRHNGDRKAAAAELRISDENVGVTLDRVGQRGALPIDLIAKLPARFAKYATVPS